MTFVVLLKYSAPVTRAFPSRSVEGSEDAAPRYVSWKVSRLLAAAVAELAAEVAELAALVALVAAAALEPTPVSTYAFVAASELAEGVARLVTVLPPAFMFPVRVPPARGSLAAIEFVTVVEKLASSPIAAANSFSVSRAAGADATKPLT